MGWKQANKFRICYAWTLFCSGVYQSAASFIASGTRISAGAKVKAVFYSWGWGWQWGWEGGQEGNLFRNIWFVLRCKDAKREPPVQARNIFQHNLFPLDVLKYICWKGSKLKRKEEAERVGKEDVDKIKKELKRWFIYGLFNDDLCS